MLSERDLIKGCKEYNIKAQQELYERFARKMMGVCYYYTGSTDDAKDLLHEGFIKVFAKFDQYKEEGSLEGWIRRVMVNTAINFLKKKKAWLSIISNKPESEVADEEIAFEEDYAGKVDFTQEEILAVVNKLPNEYRLIFNMSCLENYSHKEISELLGLKEDTCRSKLRRAREMLRIELKKMHKSKTTE